MAQRELWLLYRPYNAEPMARIYTSEARALEDYALVEKSQDIWQLRPAPFFDNPGEPVFVEERGDDR